MRAIRSSRSCACAKSASACGAQLRDAPAVAAHLAADLDQVLALAEGREASRRPSSPRQRGEPVLGRPDPLPARLHDLAGADLLVERAPADAVARLEHDARCWPARCRSRAATSPASPAPTTTTSASSDPPQVNSSILTGFTERPIPIATSTSSTARPAHEPGGAGRSAVALLTGAWWIVALLALQFALGLSFGRRWCLACVAYFELIQPRFGEGPLEDSRPPRFANMIGFGCLTGATVFFLAGLPVAGWLLTGLVAALALLAAVTGFCTGCWVHKLIYGECEVCDVPLAAR